MLDQTRPVHSTLAYCANAGLARMSGITTPAVTRINCEDFIGGACGLENKLDGK